MKLYNVFAALIVFVFSSVVFATSVNGRFVVVKSDSAKLSLLLQINTDTGADDMGGATIVIGFDKNVLNFSSDPIPGVNYTFHNFNGGKYNEATVTKPLKDKLWINIDLPSDNDNHGTVVAGLSGWTDVVTLNFDVKDVTGAAIVKWLDSNIFWQIYDGDNAANWSAGSFTNYASSNSSVELLSFTAELIDDSNIKLDWSAISYADNSGFEIERSKTSNNDVKWEKIGSVESSSILNTPVNYSYTDNIINSGSSIKYRLKSTSNDATSLLLSEIEIALPDNFELMQNFPNPFNPTTKIRYTIPQTSNDNTKVLLKVYDILGNEITTLVDETQEAGVHEVEFNASGLASGIYIYRLETQDFHDTKKMLLLK